MGCLPDDVSSRSVTVVRQTFVHSFCVEKNRVVEVGGVFVWLQIKWKVKTPPIKEHVSRK